MVAIAVFSPMIFYWALAVAMPSEKIKVAVEKDSDQIEGGDVLAVPFSS